MTVSGCFQIKRVVEGIWGRAAGHGLGENNGLDHSSTYKKKKATKVAFKVHKLNFPLDANGVVASWLGVAVESLIV